MLYKCVNTYNAGQDVYEVHASHVFGKLVSFGHYGVASEACENS